MLLHFCFVYKWFSTLSQVSFPANFFTQKDLSYSLLAYSIELYLILLFILTWVDICVWYSSFMSALARLNSMIPFNYNNSVDVWTAVA